jgi:hypothetical protein
MGRVVFSLQNLINGQGSKSTYSEANAQRKLNTVLYECNEWHFLKKKPKTEFT